MFLFLVILLVPFYFSFRWLNSKKRQFIGGTSYINKKFGIDKPASAGHSYESIDQRSSEDSCSNDDILVDEANTSKEVRKLERMQLTLKVALS